MIEILNRSVSAAGTRVALFDFDGTLSTIRSGWVDVMVPMMVQLLRDTGTSEADDALQNVVEEYVGRLTGKQTIYQMMELADQVRLRGGVPADPLVYKKMYSDALWARIEHRVESLRNRSTSPDSYLVPGSRALLEALGDRGYTLYLASGTDHAFVDDEARLLDVHRYFAGVYGALDDYKTFSKAILIARIIDSAEFSGNEFLGFGDGYVEIENVKQAGGVAVGIASLEPECLAIDEWKRQRLASVGADVIVPNYSDLPELFSVLFENHGIKV